MPVCVSGNSFSSATVSSRCRRTSSLKSLRTWQPKFKNIKLRGAWRDRDPSDIFAHCSLIFYFLDFKFSNFVLLNFILSSLSFFFFNSFRKKKNIRKTTQNALAPNIFIVLSIVVHRLCIPKRKIVCYRFLNFALEVEVWTKNLQKRCFTLPGRLWQSITFFAGRN